jgi:hypothetical protein
MTIATLGLVGLYVGRIFRQVKGRPVYVIAELLNPAGERHNADLDAYMSAKA